MRLLDLYCGAGGAGMGYHQAGFDEVVGVDLADQPNYPFEFRKGNALTLPASYLQEFDVIHASPPCQAHSDLKAKHLEHYSDLISLTRAHIQKSGVPYVIENVDSAPLIQPILLCGTMFEGLRVIRHRIFESTLPIYAPPNHPTHPYVFTYDKRKPHYGQLDFKTDFVQVTGGGTSVPNKRDAMGIDWYMSNNEVNEAIPPPYTRWVGTQILEFLNSF